MPVARQQGRAKVINNMRTVMCTVMCISMCMHMCIAMRIVMCQRTDSRPVHAAAV